MPMIQTAKKIGMTYLVVGLVVITLPLVTGFINRLTGGAFGQIRTQILGTAGGVLGLPVEAPTNGTPMTIVTAEDPLT